LTSARSYIFDNFKSNIQLDELSKIALLSKYHLLRTYKKVFEITPYQEVLKLRLDSAKKMMQTDRNLEEIAFEVGFSDRRSFTKAFKKEEGVSPSLYRKIG
jgi:AraC-like DNA-binding protein